MLYPENSADKLGFTEVKELIKAHCLSIMGQQMVDKIQVMNNFDLIKKFLSQAAEFKNILQNDAVLPINHFFDIKAHFCLKKSSFKSRHRLLLCLP
jgi:DNA mismatch repair protein MutS2